MIYTLTLNPCLDYVMECNNVNYGETNRSSCESMTFGGKGINVSFVLKELGISSKVLGFIGGFTGDELERRIVEKGIETDFVKVEKGNTRINVKVKGQDITEINAAGFKVGEKELNELYKKLDNLCDTEVIVLGGSAPKGAPDSIYEDICQKLCSKNVKFVIDTTGKKLMNCLKYKPYLIKPNKAELCEMFGCEIGDDKDVENYAKKLKCLGAENVLVSMGKEGALLVDACGKTHKVKAHAIKAVNTVGAGDSMVAGFIKGAENGYEYALKLGNACGAATAMSEGLADFDHIKDFLNEI